MPRSYYTPADRRHETAYLVGIRHARTSRHRAKADLAELTQLALAAELDVSGSVMAPVGRIDPAWFVGKGKVDQINREAEAQDAQVVVFDETLSPAQARNLEEKLNRKVIDRGNLVLDIFARRARTREGSRSNRWMGGVKKVTSTTAHRWY